MFDRSGAGDNGRGDNDGEFGLRGRGSRTSGSPLGRGLGCNTRLGVSFPLIFLFEHSLLCVLVQMGVRVRLEHHVATVSLSEDQLPVLRGAFDLTHQEDHPYAVTHFQDGFLLARNVDRWREMGTRRVFIFRVGAENKMVH